MHTSHVHAIARDVMQVWIHVHVHDMHAHACSMHALHAHLIKFDGHDDYIYCMEQ